MADRKFDEETIGNICVRAYELLPEVMLQHQGHAIAEIALVWPGGSQVNVQIAPQFLDGSVSAFAITGFLFYAAIRATEEIIGPHSPEELAQIHQRLAQAQVSAYLASCGYATLTRMPTPRGEEFAKRQEEAKALADGVNKIQLSEDGDEPPADE
jgi:hypothetical protein